MTDQTAMNMMTIAIGTVLWLVMFIMVLKSQFHKPKLKTVWIVAMLLCPPSALLFPFIGMKQTK